MADIVDTAIASPDFTTLVAAVQATGLVEALKADGPLTVFAPVDSAFAKLPEGTITTLLQNIPQLSRILTYHVVSGQWTQAQLQAHPNLTSLEESPLTADFTDGFTIKNATVITPDLVVDNGIIHIIDTVLLMG